ncbi:hypothetical protein N692_11485 [Lactiplantibacillus plantarum EGD-AQ4]|nr:hypothetical protein N692_11485 [Lactiplantibacillus plantarum EGD-AQ4]
MENITIHVLHTGIVEVDQALLYNNESINPLAYTGILRTQKNKILIPISSYLIEHPKGLILIDTGWDTEVRENPKRYLGFRYSASKPYLPDGWAINERLKKLGYHDTDIDYVVLSHLDADHASGINLVGKAKKFLTSEKEWAAANKNKIRYLKKMWKAVKMDTFKPLPNDKVLSRPFYDLFGDETILLVETPGHSKGLTSTVVKNTSGDFVLLGADVGYAGDSASQLRIPSILSSKQHAVESLA